ncbi:MAG: hypothetical protein ACLP01_23075 [Solirubrobacteraceae bacterium]
MAKQQRAVRIEQKSQMAAIQQLESRTDEELEAETKYKAHAQLVLGSRAAERMDAKTARAHFQRALIAARPQERMQFRRVADHALAIAERRADDVKIAAERLGVEAPSKKQLRGLQLLGLIAPPKSAGLFPRLRGIVIVLVLVLLILAIAFGIVSLIGAVVGISLDLRIFWTMVLVLVAGGAAVYFGRRRQRSAQAKRAEQIAARSR